MTTTSSKAKDAVYRRLEEMSDAMVENAIPDAMERLDHFAARYREDGLKSMFLPGVHGVNVASRGHTDPLGDPKKPVLKPDATEYERKRHIRAENEWMFQCVTAQRSRIIRILVERGLIDPRPDDRRWLELARVDIDVVRESPLPEEKDRKSSTFAPPAAAGIAPAAVAASAAASTIVKDASTGQGLKRRRQSVASDAFEPAVDPLANQKNAGAIAARVRRRTDCAAFVGQTKADSGRKNKEKPQRSIKDMEPVDDISPRSLEPPSERYVAPKQQQPPADERETLPPLEEPSEVASKAAAVVAGAAAAAAGPYNANGELADDPISVSGREPVVSKRPPIDELVGKDRRAFGHSRNAIEQDILMLCCELETAYTRRHQRATSNAERVRQLVSAISDTVTLYKRALRATYGAS